ncbi:MAG TPA: nuclear transport factor 2 family protein [Burkholderiales bacterium]|nr:nuclear transport factor 2 family protein [Burkholderiales bacterium]
MSLTETVEAYFASIDRQDLPATLATMAPDCTIEYVTDGSRFVGRDSGVKAYFEKRNAGCEKSWHGDFFHVADVAAGRVATRFKVRRTDRGVPERHGDNINVFQFAGGKIQRIAVWRGVPSKD